MNTIKMIYSWVAENWISILISGIIIPILWKAAPYFWNEFFATIKISPRLKRINCGNKLYRKENFYVYLLNKSSNPIYDINLSVFHPKGVEVRAYPEGKTPEEQKLGNHIIVDSSSFQLHFNSAKNKNESGVQTVINNLAPKETVKIRIEIDKKDYYKSFKLKLKAKFNSRIPKPNLST